MGGDPHGPNKLDEYIKIHESAMARYVRDGFVVYDGTELASYGAGLWVLSGDVRCVGGLILEVGKLLEYVDSSSHTVRVRTTQYRYNARLPGHGMIFRYESPSHDGHRPNHHVHRYDVLKGDQDGTIEDCDWPILSRVIEELKDWYYANYERLRPLHDS